MESPIPEIRRRGVVGVIPWDGRFLVIRRSAHVVAPGLLCFPGGGIEPGETEPEALRRELREELSLEVIHPNRRLWENVTPFGIHLAWWLTILPADASPLANPAEVAEIHWMTLEELAARKDMLVSNHAFFSAWRNGEFQLDPDLGSRG